MRVKQKISQLLATKTLKHFFITSGGTAINGLLGLLFYIYVARNLGPEEYGILAVALTSVTLLSDVADLGVDTALLRFVGKYRFEDKTLTLQFIKLGLELKFIVWLLILLGGWFLSPFIAEAIFLKPQLVQPLQLSLLGVGGALLFSLMSHTIQAFEKFWIWSFLNIFLNGLRLMAVILLVILGGLTITSTLITYIIFPFLGFFIALLFLPNFIIVKNERHIFAKFFSYSKWVALIGILTALGSRLDTLISARLLTSFEVGIYSAAVQLSVVIPQLVFALASVVAPKLASLDDDQKAITYLKKLQLLVIGIFLSGILLAPFSYFIVPLLFGQSYQGSIIPFIILFISQLIFLLALPVHQAIYYYFAKPQIFTLISLVQLLITGVLGWILITNFGVIGAALVIFINNLFGFIIPGLWVLYKFKNGGKNVKKEYLGAYVS